MNRMSLNKRAKGLFGVLLAAAMLGMLLISPVLADSEDDEAVELYKQANEYLNHRNYERAAEHFSNLYELHRDNSLAHRSQYLEAYSLYHLGGKKHLRRALGSLDGLKVLDLSRDLAIDSEELEMRIDAALSNLGDAESIRRMSEYVVHLEDLELDTDVIVVGETGVQFDGDYEAYVQLAEGDDVVVTNWRSGKSRRERKKERERERERSQEIEQKLIALQHLMQMDPDRGVPIIKKLMANKSDEYAVLRERAIFILSQYEEESAEEIMIEALRDDPDPDVREQVVFWLGQVGGERALGVLEEIALGSDDESLRESAFFSLAQIDDEQTSGVLKKIALDKGTSEELRGKAIFWLSQSDDGGDVELMRELYREVESIEVREQILFSVVQTDDEDESLEWLIDIAKDKDEPMLLRARAVFWAGQLGDIPIDALGSLYEDAEDDEMKEQVLFSLSNQDTREAITLLMELALTEENAELKTNIIFWIGQSDDERVPAFLEDIIFH